MDNKRLRAYGLLLFVSVIWGLAGPVIKNTLDTFPPLIFLSYRFALSSVIAIFYFSLHPTHIPKKPGEIHNATLQGLFTVVFGLTLLFFGFTYTDSLTGSLLASMGPLFAVLTGHFMLKEKITRVEIFGLLLALGGSFLTVVTPESLRNPQFLGLAFLGNILILLSRVSDAVGGVYIKRAEAAKVHPEALAHISFVIGFLVVFLLMLFIHPISQVFAQIQGASLEAHMGVWYMAFLSGTLAYALANLALQDVELGEASIFSYLTPLFAAPAALLWLHEEITPQFLAGAAIIAVGVVLAEWKKKKRAKKKKRRIEL